MGSNKQFNIILNECLESLLTGQETVEQCLQRYPEYGTELEPLLRTALIMNKAVDVKPSADFRAKARYQLQTMMSESKAPKRSTAFVPRWAVAVCTVLLVFILGGGTVLAADGSMPGSPLYAVKLVTENMRVKLAGSEEKKVEMYATMADRRVTEMAWMVDRGKTRDLETSAQRLNIYYEKIGEFPLAESSEMSMLTATQSVPAPAFSGTMPTQTQPVLMAPTTFVGTEVTVKSAKTNETPAPVVTVIPGNRQMEDNSDADDLNANSKTRLKNVLMYYAVIHPEKLQELLDSDKVPEAVKPALRRALWASQHSYRQVIDNLTNY